jgi:carboxyl-terminal processing protease
MRRSAKRLAAISLAALLSLGFATELEDRYFEISKNLDIFGRLYKEIYTSYVEDTDPEKLMRVGIDAMLRSLDPYTTFISETEAEDARFLSTGSYGGIGALVGKREERMVIVEVYEGYPADRAGLRPGDELLQVDSLRIGAQTQVAEVRNLLRGEQGGPVSIQVKRSGAALPLRFDLVRGQVKIDNVPYYGLLEGKIGYIVLTGFTQDASREVERAIASLRQQQPGLQGLVLDLRDNPGGRLDEAVKIANLFLPYNELIVETRGRAEGSRRLLRATQTPLAPDLPLAVLINPRSASASEVVSGAIQDLDRGLILGQRSFGKGLVQHTRPLVYNAQVRVTTARYYTPSGRCIQAVNYAQRNEDGSVARIPDSLRNEFLTRRGRRVLDGGGIEPDIALEAQRIKTITRALEQQGILFDFIAQYSSTHPRIAPPAEFQVDDALYQEFVRFATKKNFRYHTAADEELGKLREIVGRESLEGLLSEKLDELDRQLQARKLDDLSQNREEIAALLRQEMLRHYYYRRGMIEASLGSDQEVEAARKALLDQALYRKTLRLAEN